MASSSSSNGPGQGHSPAFANYNGSLYPAGSPFLTADNRGFRYGDGLFETMFVAEGRIRLGDFHFDRLLAGMRFLQFEIPPFFVEKLRTQVLELCAANGQPTIGPAQAARVRLVIFRGDSPLAGPIDSSPNYILQSWPLPAASGMNPGGLALGVFPDGRKACDALSNLKSNNYLLYTLATHYAQGQGLDDCLVLNSYDRPADSTIANLFYIRQGRFYTPPLSEGGVAGVMRRYLLEALPRAGYSVQEEATTIEDLLAADELFLTNALKGIRWVRSLRKDLQGALQEKHYKNDLSTVVYEQLIKTL
jgi:branched-chain amino acid aminotransferase